jgi:hypothetical protein
VAAAITANPSLMRRLEEVSRQAIKIDTKIEAEIGITGLDFSLLDYLRRADSLAPVTRLLVNFSPLTENP